MVKLSSGILLVDDHRDTLEALAHLLNLSGHHVATAASFGEALAVAARQEFDFYLLDIRLPDGDGYDLLALLKESQSAPAAALTGSDSFDIWQRAEAAGFEDVLIKPVMFTDVQNVILATTVRRSPAAGVARSGNDGLGKRTGSPRASAQLSR